MNIEEKLALITNGLEETIGEEKIKEILAERNLRLYWGTAPTGRPHIGYLKPLLKIAEFLKAGCEVTILFADLHAYLDAMKSSLEQLEYRTKYYEFVIMGVLEELVGLESLSLIKFVRGTEYQLTKEYNFDKYKLMSMMSVRDATKAGTEVVKQSKNPNVGSLLYPGLQALDEEYLNVDAQFGGIDQRKIFMLARKYLPKLGYSERIHLMNPIIPSLKSGTSLAEQAEIERQRLENEKSPDKDNKQTKDTKIKKMSASEDNTKIDLMDTAKQIRKKIGKAFCEEGNLDCGLLEFVKHVLFPINIIKNGNSIFTINRPEQYGGNISYESFEELAEQFKGNKLSSVDLKQGVSSWLNSLLENVRNKLNTNPTFIESIAKGY